MEEEEEPKEGEEPKEEVTSVVFLNVGLLVLYFFKFVTNTKWVWFLHVLSKWEKRRWKGLKLRSIGTRNWPMKWSQYGWVWAISTFYGDRMLMTYILVIIQLWCLSYWSNFAFLFSVHVQSKWSWKGGIQWILQEDF